ncbi:prephenate dehydratase domain-containing protein, partial [Anaerotruncus colihominis]|uniref:prephenate dehydratase domain-containing protein n=1 Tax=Anaerotruncus colihominis TaxID=169435 RepID=UPI003AB4FEE2
MSPKCNKCYISQLLSYRHQTQFVNGCPLAAELFGLNILEEDAQDQACNTTRFAVIGRQETQP